MNELILKTRLTLQESWQWFLERKIEKQVNANFDLQHEIEILQAQLSQGEARLERMEDVSSHLKDRIEATETALNDIAEKSDYDLDLSNI